MAFCCNCLLLLLRNHHSGPGNRLLSTLELNQSGIIACHFFRCGKSKRTHNFGSFRADNRRRQSLDRKHHQQRSSSEIGEQLRAARPKYLRLAHGTRLRETLWCSCARYSTQRSILNNAEGDEDQPGFHIVDSTVRPSGSLCLPLSGGHPKSLGLRSASSFAISVRKDRDDSTAPFPEEFKFGSMALLSWNRDPKTGVSLAYVAAGA